MPTDYAMVDPLPRASVEQTVATALSGASRITIQHIPHGSANALYRVRAGDQQWALKISYRPDRIEGGILAKEGRLLRRFGSLSWPIPIPTVIWEGATPDRHPALLMSWLPGTSVRLLMKRRPTAIAAIRQVGAFNARFHELRHPEIDEFESGRPAFRRFADCVNYWLGEWAPLLRQAEPHHIPQPLIDRAMARIREQLHWFDDADWAYVHADVSPENLLGEIRNGELILTGLCDFETVQTGPAEYDLGNASNGFFIFWPELEAPFYEGYLSVRSLHPHHEQRMIACTLFRALRYIKRSVKYHETHYYDHDRQFLEAWLNR